ncbi:MAG: Xaa-Pro peptidase family protein [Phycisphaerales bacterium]|nr:Xaa-Pro peptidase family protein [Phycisphaerales bacterium]
MSLIADAQLDPAAVAACTQRLTQARAAMAAAGVQAMLLTQAADVIWVTDTHGHDCQVLLLPDQAVILSDRRYEEYLAAWGRSELWTIDLAPRTEQMQMVKDRLAAAGIDRLGIQKEHCTLATHDALKAAVDPVTVVPVNALLITDRQCKDDREVAACCAAIGVQHAALDATLDAFEHAVLAGEQWTEARFAAKLIEQMRARGAQSEAFEPIIGSRANSSVIHHVPGDTVITPGVLLVDWGAKVDNRCSDLTRTLFLGDTDDTLTGLFAVVAKAHQAAIEACQPGAPVKAPDAAARAVIEAAGYGDEFPHGVGHGLGLDVHETPFMGRKAESGELKPGMIVTIEPGIYLPGQGGVRIEDDILITDTGHRVLSADVPRDLHWSARPWPGS